MPPKKKRSTRRTADCIVDGCDECATHILKAFTVRVPTHCEQHAQPDDDFFKFDNRLCEVETCRKRAYFRSPDVKSTKPVRCKDHKNPDDVDNTPRCPCPLQRVPVFGPPGSKTRGFRCSTCRLDTDVDIRNTRCKLCNTNQVRTYVPGEDPTVLTICMTCAHVRNYDVPNTGEKLCLGCNSVQATFGVFGGRTCVRTCKPYSSVYKVIRHCVVRLRRLVGRRQCSRTRRRNSGVSSKRVQNVQQHVHGRSRRLDSCSV